MLAFDSVISERNACSYTNKTEREKERESESERVELTLFQVEADVSLLLALEKKGNSL